MPFGLVSRGSRVPGAIWCGAEPGIAKSIVTAVEALSASCSAARNVQVPAEVRQTPLPAWTSDPSPVELTTRTSPPAAVATVGATTIPPTTVAATTATVTNRFIGTPPPRAKPIWRIVYTGGKFGQPGD